MAANWEQKNKLCCRHIPIQTVWHSRFRKSKWIVLSFDHKLSLVCSRIHSYWYKTHISIYILWTFKQNVFPSCFCVTVTSAPLLWGGWADERPSTVLPEHPRQFPEWAKAESQQCPPTPTPYPQSPRATATHWNTFNCIDCCLSQSSSFSSSDVMWVVFQW